MFVGALRGYSGIELLWVCNSWTHWHPPSEQVPLKGPWGELVDKDVAFVGPDLCVVLLGVDEVHDCCLLGGASPHSIGISME